MVEKLNIQELIKISKELKLLYVEDDESSRDATLDVLNLFFDNITIATDGLYPRRVLALDIFACVSGTSPIRLLCQLMSGLLPVILHIVSKLLIKQSGIFKLIQL